MHNIFSIPGTHYTYGHGPTVLIDRHESTHSRVYELARKLAHEFHVRYRISVISKGWKVSPANSSISISDWTHLS